MSGPTAKATQNDKKRQHFGISLQKSQQKCQKFKMKMIPKINKGHYKKTPFGRVTKRGILG